MRARAHLEPLLPALRAAGIPVAAVELDALAERVAVQDLVSLTHALIQPADRLAWLAVLRAPWCALALPDLFAIVAAADARRDGSIAGLMHAPDVIAGLSPDGRRRFARVAPVLSRALAARRRAGVAARVRGAWLALGAAATLTEPIDLDAIERFLSIVADFEVAGDVPDWPALVYALARLYAEPDPGTARVQIMTLHRAKGLEFDTVILPGLARLPNRGGAEILRWRRRPCGLLLAPMKARGADTDLVYAYLRRLADGEESAELSRLLYVGCTRAKRRLHLTGVLEALRKNDDPPAWKAPPPGSALAKFWHALGRELPPPIAANVARPPSPPPRLLNRLPAGWSIPSPQPGVPGMPATSSPQEILPFDWAREAAKHVGTVAHRLFAQIARDGIAAWDASRVTSLAPRLRAELAAEGVDEAELAAAAAEVTAAVSGMLVDPRGRWLFDPAHSEASSEWALAGWDGKAMAHVAVDRTFVTEGVRWIVDFKTGMHEGADREGFLDRERERYAPQLARYAAFVRALDARPIRLALYHPLLSGWREWAYADGGAGGRPSVK